jgi:NAD dependent epimerase/dehydratase
MNLTNKRVLVTGADGFIGSHLVESLLNEGCDIKAFVFYNSFNSLGWIDAIPNEKLKHIEIFTGDIRDPNGVRTAVKDVEVVLHLAALIAIPFSYHSPDMYVDTNIKGTLNILQACRDYNIEKVIVTSTSEVYGTSQYVPMDEKHPLQGQSPYSATKIGADVIADSFYRSFDLPVVIARPFNTYGPRQSARAVIPTIITQLLNGNENILLGSLHPTRDFTFVSDIVEAFIKIAECDETIGKTFNIGSGFEISIGELTKRIAKLINKDNDIILDEKRIRPQKSEVQRLWADSTLAQKTFGWRPKVSIEEGLQCTIEWISANLDKYDIGAYTI